MDTAGERLKENCAFQCIAGQIAAAACWEHNNFSCFPMTNLLSVAATNTKTSLDCFTSSAHHTARTPAQHSPRATLSERASFAPGAVLGAVLALVGSYVVGVQKKYEDVLNEIIEGDLVAAWSNPSTHMHNAAETIQCCFRYRVSTAVSAVS